LTRQFRCGKPSHVESGIQLCIFTARIIKSTSHTKFWES
jgi:hypothetical protein